jgi:HAD superfamily phosphoserine phosphatase-like hydrolase
MIELAVFDLDGTLLRGPTVCEVLARPIGKLERMRELERGACDLKAARAEMAGWYRASGYGDARLVELLAAAEIAPGADEGCALLRGRAVEIALASVTWSFAVEHFAQRFGASTWLATTLGKDGEIGHVFAADKAAWLERLARERGIDRGRIAAVGDSVGDVPMLRVAGTAIFVGAALCAGAPSHVRHLPSCDIRDVARAILAVRH